jgi:hypothetical protein
MRAAGCTPAEVMATRPREVLRTLPTSPELWEVAAVTMTESGHSTPAVVSHLVAHAPNAETFALALTAVAEDPAGGLAVAVRYGAQADHLAAGAEAYGLTPEQAATALADAGATRQITVEAIHALCDRDTDVTARAMGLPADDVHDLLVTPTQKVTPLMHDSPDPTDASSLLAHLPDPEPSTDLSPEGILAALPEPEAAAIETPEATP